MSTRPRHGGSKSLAKARQRVRKLEHERDRLQAQVVNEFIRDERAEHDATIIESLDAAAILSFHTIARAIRESVVLEPLFPEEDPEGWRKARQLLAAEIADGLEGVYGKFDRDHFLEEATR